MDLNATVDVNCERMDVLTEGRRENQMPILHPAKAGATTREKQIIDYFVEVNK